MSATERRKGATYERELVRDLKAAGFDAERTSRGVAQAQKGDVIGVPGLHIEAKRCQTISLPKWLAQAEADCPTGSVPAVVFRRNAESSRAVVPWDWLLGLLVKAREEGK